MTTNLLGNTCPNDFTVTKASNAGTTKSLVQHLTDAASSQACQILSVAGTSADDVYTRLSIGTTTTYALGIDNSDSDKFKISYHADSASPSSTALLTSTIAGEINKPLQPTFLATQVTANNVTGDNTVYTMTYGTEVYDIASNFSGGIFTAPVTGKYLMGSNISLSGVDQDGLQYITIISTSNRDYYGTYVRMWSIAAVGDGYMSVNCGLFDLDAADTCRMKIRATGGNKTYDVADGGNCYMYGDLLI